MKTSWTGSFEAPDNSILPYQDLVLELSFRMLFLCGSCYVISSEMINYVCYEYFDAISRLLSIAYLSCSAVNRFDSQILFRKR